ncbi:MAG TPA: thioredoxin family protein [Bacillota bacterium]|nr:thioredoxin family protein [Bacillota bacterium]
MHLNEWYDKAMSSDTYIGSMKQHKDNLLYIYEQFQLPEDDTFFQKLADKQLRVIALTEDWCGDAMLNIPILLRIAEKADMPVRMLLRDDNLELMDQYLTNGKSRSIPIFIFIDETGQERAKWGPRAAKVQAFVDQSRSGLPPKDADNYKEKFQEVISYTTNEFLNNTRFWDDVYHDLKQTLEKIL